jgi:hypothetical protein
MKDEIAKEDELEQKRLMDLLKVKIRMNHKV